MLGKRPVKLFARSPTKKKNILDSIWLLIYSYQSRYYTLYMYVMGVPQ
jgi:hypothetical protein